MVGTSRLTVVYKLAGSSRAHEANVELARSPAGGGCSTFRSAAGTMVTFRPYFSKALSLMACTISLVRPAATESAPLETWSSRQSERLDGEAERQRPDQGGSGELRATSSRPR